MTKNNDDWLPYHPEDNQQTHLLRAILMVRCTQGMRSAPTVLIVATFILATLWHETPLPNLLLWLAAVSSIIITAYSVFRHIGRHINQDNQQQLTKHRNLVTLMTAISAGTIGAAFWLIGLNGSQEMIFTTTLIVCLYCIGLMINASVDTHSIPPAILLTMGQGILFFSGVGHPPQPIVAVSLAAVSILLFSFGQINARQFAESM